MTLKILGLILFVELCEAASHILFKRSVNAIDPSALRNITDYARFLRTVLQQPAVWAGLLLFTGGILTWFVVLAHVELSRAFPFGSLQYLTIMVASAVFLRERIDRRRLVGTLCIVLGIIFVALN